MLKYISVIKEKKICERYFNELKNIKQIQFDFRSKEKPADFVEKYVEKFMNYNEDVFTADSIIKEYDEKILSNFYKIVPIKNKDKLIFSFYFPFCDNYVWS